MMAHSNNEILTVSTHLNAFPRTLSLYCRAAQYRHLAALGSYQWKEETEAPQSGLWLIDAFVVAREEYGKQSLIGPPMT